jgi:hypothetical protein
MRLPGAGSAFIFKLMKPEDWPLPVQKALAAANEKAKLGQLTAAQLELVTKMLRVMALLAKK